MPVPTSANVAYFGPFELDLKAWELHQDGRKIRLQEQPFQVLKMLLEHPNAVVTREEIRRRLWPNDTIVEFDQSINAAVKKLRVALEDSADEPRYVETLARRGYRLMVQVKWQEASLGEARSDKRGNSHHSQPTVNGSLIGKKISHYRVLQVIGGGGMGVVYAAEDLKLGRRVALKFLPEELGKDTKALDRFEREARAASALDHLNICPIYEFGEHEGQPFMALPLLEGQTLRDRMAAGNARFTVDELLNLAIQIANGLATAHSKGIIHRDVKPANIFVTQRGEVKILDFGLAKLAHSVELEPMSTPGLAMEPAVNLSLTRTGAALGTAAYMSPEQVRGGRLDARTDLFSFGLVLYEMATGRQAFAGNTESVVQDGILHHTHVPARQVNPELPMKLEQLINRALDKDRELRYQSATDMCSDLKGIRGAREVPTLHRPWAVMAAIAMLLLTSAALWLTKRQSSLPAGVPELKQRQLTANSTENAVLSGAISPDGKYLAYSDMQGIHVKHIESGATQTVPQPGELKELQVNWGIVPTWAGASTFIANANIPGQKISTWAVPAFGGPPRKLRNDANAASVSRDGALVEFMTGMGALGYSEVWVMTPDGQQARKIFQADENSGFDGGEWSPDGQRLSLGFGHQVGDKFEWNMINRDLNGGSAIVDIPGPVWDHTWSPDGRIIYSLNDPAPNKDSCNYWAVPIDPLTGKPGATRRLTSWAGFCMDSTSPTADGKRLAFRKQASQGNVYVADLLAGGTRITTPKSLTLSEGRSYPAAWTSDSKAIIFESYREGQWKIFRQALRENVAEPIAAGAQVTVGAGTCLSPDGLWILYLVEYKEDTSSPLLSNSALGSKNQLMRVPITGGSPEVVLGGDIYDRPVCAKSPAGLCAIAEETPDHKQLVFTAFDPVKGRGRVLTQIDIDTTNSSLRGTPNYAWDLSPNGTRIAILKYTDNLIHILPLTGQAPQEIAVKGWNSLESLNWSADGKALFASSATQGGSALLRVDLRGNPQVLWRQTGSIARWYVGLGGPSTPWAIPSPDGRHLAIYDWKLSANMWMIENF